MSAKAAVYLALGKNSMIYMIRTGQNTKQKKKSDKTAEKNTSNGILARSRISLKEF